MSEEKPENPPNIATPEQVQQIVDKKIQELNASGDPADRLTHSQVEDMIRGAVAEAKLSASDSRNNWTLLIGGLIIAFFGVVVPLVWTKWNDDKVNQSLQRNEDKTAQAIKEMQDRFNELAGEQLRKAVISCEFEGRPLANATVSITPDKIEEPSGRISARNIGDKSGGESIFFLRLPLLPNGASVFTWDPTDGFRWGDAVESGDPNISKFWLFHTESFHAKREFGFSLGISGGQTLQGKDLPATLEIFYDAPEPLRVPFTIRLVAKKDVQPAPADANKVK